MSRTERHFAGHPSQLPSCFSLICPMGSKCYVVQENVTSVAALPRSFRDSHSALIRILESSIEKLKVAHESLVCGTVVSSLLGGNARIVFLFKPIDFYRVLRQRRVHSVGSVGPWLVLWLGSNDEACLMVGSSGYFKHFHGTPLWHVRPCRSVNIWDPRMSGAGLKQELVLTRWKDEMGH